jgi:tRNA A37 threonylcarbamoyladenosine modification protein TsaB
MKIFSLDTSFSFLNFSVIDNGKLAFLCYLDNSKKTLENLPKVLLEYNVKPQDYDAFAISVGAGYLTSVRIGITFIKTWAYLFNKPVVGYENLEMMAKYIPVDFPKIPCLKVSHTVFYRVAEKDRISEVKTSKECPSEGHTISLKEHGIQSSKIVLEFFPFSTYGGMYAYEKLSSGYKGDDLFFLEPLYVTSSLTP